MAYLAPIHRPSSVRHAIKISFLTPDGEDLIVAKANRLEIWAPHPQAPEQLILQHTKTLYGKVTLLHKLRPATSPTDHLFVGTDRYHYFTLSWDGEKEQIRTEKSYVDVAEKAARDSQTGDRVHIDPSNRFMTLECYEGVVNVLPIVHAGKGKRRAADNEIGDIGEPIPVRVPELFTRSTCFLHKRQAGPKLPDPEFALLEEDSQQKLRIKIRDLEYIPSLRPHEEPATAELEKVKEVSGQVELGSSHLIPLPPPIYGFLVVGETSISYVEEWNYKIARTKPLEEATVFVSWCAIDVQRYALADDYGKLYLLYIQQTPEGEYVDHQIDVLGGTSRASTLVYLSSGRVFVGSNQGDSQIIQILPKGLEVIQTFSNIGPILDFTVMDMGNRSSDAPVNEFSSGQARIVTGSGAFKDGSLRSVRSGVGLDDLGSIGEMGAPISVIFNLSSTGSGLSDTLLVSFVSHSRVFQFDTNGEVEETEHFKGFDLSEATLYAGVLPDGRAVQVTSSAVVVTDQEGKMIVDTWNPPAGASISSAAAERSTILLSLQGAALVVLDLSEGGIRRQAHREFERNEQISCITLNSAISKFCVVGFWKDSKVSFLDLETLQPIATQVVVDDGSLAVPRSLKIARILPDAPASLFIGLADGNVITYSIQSMQQPFTARKSIVLGTQQPNFTSLPRGNGLENVFAICEHPSLIYGSEGRMVYSAVTAENATSICHFDSEAYPGAIAIATADAGELKLAMVDEERTTHVETLTVNETVRRIAYSPALKAFGLGTIKRTLTAGVEEVVSHFKLVDEVVFQELHTYALDEDELIESVMRCQLDDGSGDLAERFVVGTAYLEDDGKDGVRGRILIFEVTESRQLKLVTEQALKGACRCLAMCEGKIVAALIKTVVIYSFEYETPSQPSLVKTAAYRTATAPIDISVTNNVIAVSDLMKSVSLVEYTAGRGGTSDSLREVARHFETLWGTAIANVSENTYLESDAEGNLVVLQHEVSSYSEEDKRRLRVTSEILLGEMVNRVRRIDVQPTANAIVIPRAFIATVEGSIYLFAVIAPNKQDLLMRMQSKMGEMVKAPGFVPFNKFRGFKTNVRDMGEEGPMRFVDGELIERFLDCNDSVQKEIVGDLGADLEDIRGMVEALRRIH